MILISHRGNINSKNPDLENTTEYLLEALQRYSVEIDIWMVDGQLFFGHDYAQHKVPQGDIENICSKARYNKNLVFFHAKNVQALKYCLEERLCCFMHDKDEAVLTSTGLIWTYPGRELTTMSIAVLPETVDCWDGLNSCVGVCSDFLEGYEEMFNK